MTHNNRDKDLLWAYRMDGVDALLHPCGIVWFLFGLADNNAGHLIAATVFVGLLRIRIILRDIRMDGLRRDAAEADRRP